MSGCTFKPDMYLSQRSLHYSLNNSKSIKNISNMTSLNNSKNISLDANISIGPKSGHKHTLESSSKRRSREQRDTEDSNPTNFKTPSSHFDFDRSNDISQYTKQSPVKKYNDPLTPQDLMGEFLNEHIPNSNRKSNKPNILLPDAGVIKG